MTGINHKQAQRYLRAAADGLLRENQRALLDAHLRDCDSCRAEADELSALEARLKKNFQARWDANDGPSTNVMTTIQSRSRRIIMTNRIKTGLKTAAGLATLLVLIVFLNSAVGKLRNTSIPSSATESIDTTQSTQSSGLIAFVSMQDGGNYEIFTMKVDGSEVTNLTNNPATDEYPAWSPDGTQIAFVSDRDGGRDIYIMNANGNNVRKLTDSSTFNDHFTWSPDGEKIVYLSGENSLFEVSQIMVMNADGSNKIPLTPQPGKYNFLSWSMDGQYIVFQDSNSGQKGDTRVLIANINGGVVMDGPFFEGDTGRQHQQVHWETPNQFVTISSNFEQKTWGQWNITRFFTSGDNSLYNGSNPPILVTSENPIFAIFENTYVTLDKDSLAWFSYKDAPIPYSPWKMSSTCEKKVIFDLQKAPDGKHGFVIVACEGDSTSFYLINSDGSEINQLGAPLPQSLDFAFPVWSPNGRQILLSLPDQRKQHLDFYLLDIEKMLSDPSALPAQLTTDGANKYGAVWQPQPKEEPVVIKATEEKPTPELLIFSLTVQEVEALAGFDVLEPTYLPEAYIFQGAGYDSQTQKVALKYGDNSSLGVIYIFQKRGDFPIDPTLPSHTTPAPVGDVIGEFVHGAWIYESGATTPQWDGSADYYALSWKKDGISFSVDFLGGETIPNINLKGLRDIAESMK